MLVKNRRKHDVFMRGVTIKSGATMNVPGLTKKELTNSVLRSSLVIVKDEKKTKPRVSSTVIEAQEKVASKGEILSYSERYSPKKVYKR